MSLIIDKIQVDAELVYEPGKGYGFPGGFIDLEPWNRRAIQVGQNVAISFVRQNGPIRFEGTARIRLGAYAGRDELIAEARRYEAQAVEAGHAEFTGLADAIDRQWPQAAPA